MNWKPSSISRWLAVCKNATVLLVVGDALSSVGVINALTYTINKNLAPIVSMSYGKCEQSLTASEYNAVTALLAQAAAQGITVLVGSGDSGPAGCDQASPITHAASVDFPAITALLVQKTGEPQGNINPRLYAIAATSPGAFHDVTQGSTVFNCNLQALGCPFGTFGFQAGTGYDQATGLGSVDAANLINAWPDFGLSSNPPALTVARGAVGTATISVSPVNGFNDAVTLSCTVSNSLTNTSCSIPSAPSPDRTASLTITAGATAGLSIWELPPAGWDNSTGLACWSLPPAHCSFGSAGGAPLSGPTPASCWP